MQPWAQCNDYIKPYRNLEVMPSTHKASHNNTLWPFIPLNVIASCLGDRGGPIPICFCISDFIPCPRKPLGESGLVPEELQKKTEEHGMH